MAHLAEVISSSSNNALIHANYIASLPEETRKKLTPEWIERVTKSPEWLRRNLALQQFPDLGQGSKYILQALELSY